jgi:hypothetical protein
MRWAPFSATPQLRISQAPPRLMRFAGCAILRATQSLQCIGRLFLQVRNSVPPPVAKNPSPRDAATTSGFVCRPYPWAPPNLKQSEGLAPFSTRTRGAVCRLGGRAGRGRGRREPGFGRRAQGPGIRQTIDPMRGQEIASARKKPEPVSSFGTSGQAPALHASRIFHDLCLLSLIPSFSPCEAGTAAFRRRVRRLSSAVNHYATILVFCQGIQKKYFWRLWR